MNINENLWLVDHRPVPGTMYRKWQCLRCGEPVVFHPRLLRRLARRLIGR